MEAKCPVVMNSRQPAKCLCVVQAQTEGNFRLLESVGSGRGSRHMCWGLPAQPPPWPDWDPGVDGVGVGVGVRVSMGLQQVDPGRRA